MMQFTQAGAGRSHDLGRVSELVRRLERRVDHLLGRHEVSEMLCYVVMPFPQAKKIVILPAS